MREGEPGWFYVGNGQLQYKDSDGWTDQYKTYRGPRNHIPDGEHRLVRSGRRESVAQREEASPENTSSRDCGLCGAAKTRRCTWMGLMGDRARRARFPQGAGPEGFPYPCRYLQRPPLAAHGPAGSHGAWRMAHGKSIIGTANGAPPGSSQGSQSGAATRVGRRPGCEWARPPSATGHPLSLIWASPKPAAEDLTRNGGNVHLLRSGSGVASLSEF